MISFFENIIEPLGVHYSDANLAQKHKFIDNLEVTIEEFISVKSNSPFGYVSPSASIHETAILGRNIIIGDNVKIGPYSFLKSNVVLLESAQIGYNVELDRCLIGQSSKIAHVACIGRSIIGNNANLGYNFVIATKNLNENKVKSYFRKDFYESTRNHHGAIIGNFFKCGVNVSIMPGTTILDNVKIGANKQVKGFINSGNIF